ncbi:MAG TPA: hypothetical protein VMI35_11405 [Puia sp.]|nr:hypothetical protein [Puia sp.]
MLLIDIIGWIGSAMVVAAYALNMYKKLAADTMLYYLLNIIGSACLIVNTFFHHAIPSAVVNIIWVLIALAALWKKRRSAPPSTTPAPTDV